MLSPVSQNSGMICLNGAAARQVSVGDHVIIMCYAQMTPEEAKDHKPHVVFVDGDNHIAKLSRYEKHGSFHLYYNNNPLYSHYKAR